MSLSAGIVGLPNVGKSTLFNALLKKQQAFVANYPFATIEPNVGIVPVPDARLKKLAEVISYQGTKVLSKKALNNSVTQSLSNLSPIVPATVTFVDIAGLIAGAHKGEGLGNTFLAHIREVDAIAHVVRAFEDSNVVKEGSMDPKSDFETVRTELELADLEHPDAPPLAGKPVLVVVNVGEDQLTSESVNKLISRYAKELGVEEENIVIISAKIEAELAGLSEDEAKAYLRELGLEQSGLERLVEAGYRKLGLMSFLTAGEKEVRAWTIHQGTKASQAAGVIHTDFEKKFIKADVVSYEDFVNLGGWKNCREKGKVRSEGRDYIMRAGDVVEFKIGT